MKLVLTLFISIIFSFNVEAVSQSKSKEKSSFIILSLEEGRKVLNEQCSREAPKGVTSYWVPSTEDVKKLERDFVKCVKGTLDLASYLRQYTGFKRGQKSFLYSNFELKAGNEPSQKATIACDGGNKFFGFIYNSSTRTFTEFRFNGRSRGLDQMPGFSESATIQCK